MLHSSLNQKDLDTSCHVLPKQIPTMSYIVTLFIHAVLNAQFLSLHFRNWFSRSLVEPRTTLLNRPPGSGMICFQKHNTKLEPSDHSYLFFPGAYCRVLNKSLVSNMFLKRNKRIIGFKDGDQWQAHILFLELL